MTNYSNYLYSNRFCKQLDDKTDSLIQLNIFPSGKKQQTHKPMFKYVRERLWGKRKRDKGESGESPGRVCSNQTIEKVATSWILGQCALENIKLGDIIITLLSQSSSCCSNIGILRVSVLVF